MRIRTLLRPLTGAAASAALVAGVLLGTTAPAQAAGGYCSDALRPGYARLASGQQLTAGQSFHNGRTYLVMQADGNLVQRLTTFDEAEGPHVWSSGTWGNPGAHAVMQPDGNFVVYREDGSAAWSTGTWGNPGACAELTDDGNLTVARDDRSGVVFSAQSGRCYCNGLAGTPTDVLGSWRYSLYRGQWLESTRTWLTLQGDGEFALYRKSDGAQLWRAGTYGRGSRVLLQPDGNLIVFGASGEVVAATGTWGNSGAELRVQSDGNVVLYRTNGTAIWSTGTYGRV